MTWPDVVNGSLELVGAWFAWVNVMRLYRDRRIRGVDWRAWVFYMAWGWWNLWYYPSLDQWASAIGGAVMVLANTVWVILALKWRKR